MCQIVPSLLVDSQAEFERRLRLAEGGAELIHVDVLDGSFVPGQTWHDAKKVGKLKTNATFELHLMVEDPLTIAKEWQAHVPGLRRTIVHAELAQAVLPLLQELKGLGLETGLALNPESPLEEVAAVVRSITQLTLMGVHPGASGQRFIGPAVLQKIRDAKKRWPHLMLELDGGATPELISGLLAAGCDRIVAANAIFGAADPSAALASLSRLASLRTA